jgi:hypothetical protein
MSNITITLSDFDIHGGGSETDRVGWKVRVTHADGCIDGALFLTIPRGRTDLADAVGEMIAAAVIRSAPTRP